ncbi:chorismate--pyruvate lyase family protein [Nocardia mangyaensis]|uniref:chorismate--pyruvate lyase family protein n=1 Tax=Nocardia mangyaensis TaxID=2213200 RepID=UPI0026775D91|nr:chorismate pyruvate-lyase family protein [Nocardia mangyaensis]MDO3646212.1 chorismate pyruvate-lyase family protein [Nocardia mangyaensis]
MESLLEPAPIPVSDFADPTTRALLACDGSTTVLVEAMLRARVTIDVREQFEQPAAALPHELRCALGLCGSDHVLVRNSVLLAPGERPVSWNHAVVVATDGNPLYPLCFDRTRPLGSAMAAAEISLRRQVLYTGHHRRPVGGPGPAAGKCYLICTDGVPRLHMTEVYSPELFPADLAVQRSAPSL